MLSSWSASVLFFPVHPLCSLRPAHCHPSVLWTDLWSLPCFSLPKTSRKAIIMDVELPKKATANEEVTVILRAATQFRECMVVSRGLGDPNLKEIFNFLITSTVRWTSHFNTAYYNLQFNESQSSYSQFSHVPLEPQEDRGSSGLTTILILQTKEPWSGEVSEGGEGRMGDEKSTVKREKREKSVRAGAGFVRVPPGYWG